MIRETDYKKRFALWEQMHKAFYEKVPVIRYGDLFGLRATSKKLQGLNEKTERVRPGTSGWTSSTRHDRVTRRGPSHRRPPPFSS